MNIQHDNSYQVEKISSGQLPWLLKNSKYTKAQIKASGIDFSKPIYAISVKGEAAYVSNVEDEVVDALFEDAASAKYEVAVLSTGFGVADSLLWHEKNVKKGPPHARTTVTRVDGTSEKRIIKIFGGAK